MPKAITIHQILTWVAGVASAVTASVVLSVSGSFMDMRDSLIRMEGIPSTVTKHEERLDKHDLVLSRFSNPKTQDQ